MSFHVRAATHEDLEALVASTASLFAEDGGTRDEYMDTSWPARHGHEYYRAAIEDPRSLCLLAVGDVPVGHLIGRLGRPDELRPGAVTATLESMRVAEEARGTGVGTALHDAFLAWTRKHNVNELQVHAYASNSVALDFYRSRGYEPHTVGLRRKLVDSGVGVQADSHQVDEEEVEQHQSQAQDVHPGRAARPPA